jgi:predicted small secreted protein
MKRIGDALRLRAVLIAALALVAAFVIAGCGDDKNSGSGRDGQDAGQISEAEIRDGKLRDPKDIENEKKNFSAEPPPVQISTGDKSGINVSKPKLYLVNSTSEMRSLKKDIFSNGVKRQTIAPSDFKTRQVVGLVMPKQPKGTLVIISDVHQVGNSIVVGTVRLLRGKGCSTAPYRPNPYHLVETRKMTANSLKLEIKDSASSPCK